MSTAVKKTTAADENNLLRLHVLFRELIESESNSGDNRRWRMMINAIAVNAGIDTPVEHVRAQDLEMEADKHILRHLRRAATEQPESTMHKRLREHGRHIIYVVNRIDRLRDFAANLNEAYICLKIFGVLKALHASPGLKMSHYLFQDFTAEILEKANAKLIAAVGIASVDNISVEPRSGIPMDRLADIRTVADEIILRPAVVTSEFITQAALKAHECELLVQEKARNLEKWRRELLDKRNDEFKPLVAEAVAALPQYLKNFVPHKYHPVGEPEATSAAPAV